MLSIVSLTLAVQKRISGFIRDAQADRDRRFHPSKKSSSDEIAGLVPRTRFCRIGHPDDSAIRMS